MQSSLVRIVLSFNGKPVQAWQPVVLTRSQYQRLVTVLDFPMSNRLRVDKHRLHIDTTEEKELDVARRHVTVVVAQRLDEEPNPDEMRVENRALVAA